MPITEPTLRGPYNRCAACGIETLLYKFCPMCGKEFEHVAPEERCPLCTNVVWFKGQKFCGLCGTALTVSDAVQVDATDESGKILASSSQVTTVL